MIGLFLNHRLNPLRRRGVYYISVPKICKTARGKEIYEGKGIKAEDVKNLPPIEEIHGLNTPPLPKEVEVNSLMKFNDNDNAHNMHPSHAFMSLETILENKVTSMQMS